MTTLSFTPARVLLVDDDPAQLRLWRHMLDHGLGDKIQIEALTDAYAAMKYAQNHSVDILVTDLSMPDVCGLDLVRVVKARNRCAQALLITGLSTTQSLLESLEVGASDYLLKPFPAELLVEIVRQADARLRRWRDALAGVWAATSRLRSH